MLNNSKGTVLVVAVVSMMIMMIIALVCLQIYTNQGIIDTYDQIKMRTFYSAEGAVEIMRAHIDKQMELNRSEYGDHIITNSRTFLATVTPCTTKEGAIVSTDWEPFSKQAYYDRHVIYSDPVLENDFDGTMYPGVKAVVYLHRLVSSDFNRVNTLLAVPISIDYFTSNLDHEQNIGTFPKKKAYEIVATATANFKTTLGINNVVSTTVRYYFKTETTLTPGTTPLYSTTKKCVGWRID